MDNTYTKLTVILVHPVHTLFNTFKVGSEWGEEQTTFCLYVSMRYWTAKELLEVLSAAQEINPEFRDFILWASLSAMRRGEIVNMKWKDIVTLDNGKTKVHIPISKSDKPRHIPCNKQMLDILVRQRTRTIQSDDEKVFGIYYRTVGRHMQAIQLKLKEEGITDIRFHDLRTFNISTALLAGVYPNTLTGITGHSDLQMINIFHILTIIKQKKIPTLCDFGHAEDRKFVF